jgi:hypothetical protein
MHEHAGYIEQFFSSSISAKLSYGFVVYNKVQKKWEKANGVVGPPGDLSASLRSKPPLRQNVEKPVRAMSATTSVSLVVADAVWAEPEINSTS